uniref:Serine proteinase inhibitor n=1 Tax=Amblyomma variegatum TaxID=34610 RepID=F0JAA8_AMBVA|nr:TPA_inf: serine proteinase inhibitor [Amblyomma variegatum]
MQQKMLFLLAGLFLYLSDPALGNCTTPMRNGRCRANYKLYYFSQVLGRCSLFQGCLDQVDAKNSFASFSQCNKTCGRLTRDPCLFPEDNGVPCPEQSSAAPGRNTWFRFNPQKDICEPFHYHGCEGSLNRFSEEKDCWRVCYSHIRNKCNIPISGGHNCANRSHGSRYYAYGYNPTERRCEGFIYLGCGGNNNRFYSAKDCWDTCGKHSGSKCVKDPGNYFWWDRVPSQVLLRHQR